MRPLPILAILMVLATASGQQPGPTTLEEEPSCVPGECPPGDNDPAISPDEVVAPSSDWDDANPWGGQGPPYSWFEDPTSVQCGNRDACMQAVEEAQAEQLNATLEAST